MLDDNTQEWLRKYLLQMEELSKAFNASIKPILEKQACMANQIRPPLVRQSASFGAIQEVLKENSAIMDLWSEMIQANINTSVIDAFSRTVKSIVLPFTTDFLEALERLPIRMHEVLITFGQHGWYFDIEMPFHDLWELELAFKEGRTEEADAGLSGYFESRLDEIKTKIISRFKHREKIICEAFTAHKAGQYNVAIPVFFAQTDGICKDIFGRCLFYFKRSSDKPFSTLIIDQVASDALVATLVGLLDKNLPVALNESKREVHFIGLNRHMVMHGESLDYGTKFNSLKAISLLNYVARVTDEN